MNIRPSYESLYPHQLDFDSMDEGGDQIIYDMNVD